MVLNAAVQMLREADELKQKILKFKCGTSMLQERNLWVYQQQLQKIYQKVLVLDLDYALEKKVEQDLWNVGFKQQIEALQAISKDRKNPLRSDGQAMLSWVLQAAAGYYLCLLHQICTTFKLDLPFRRRASLLGWVEGWSAGSEAGEVTSSRPPPAAARYICQHCLVHLGDLARYRQQLRVAHTFYRHALVVSVHSGQPYNQLALVAWRRGRRLAALYWHVRSLLVRAPFPPAPSNLARTLHAAASGGLSQDPLPVLPGMTGVKGLSTVRTAAPSARLDANAYIAELIRAMHMIHTVEQLDTAAAIVNTLNTSLPPLVAANSFESMTLVKMSCVVIWLVHSSSEDLELEKGALSEGEAAAAQLSTALAAGVVLALALATAAGASAAPTASRQLPALKVWLQWYVCQARAPASGAWAARALLWPALAAALNTLQPPPAADDDGADRPAPDLYEWCPLPEDEELHGFTPLQAELEPLQFSPCDWDSYSGRLPDDRLHHEQPWSPGLAQAEVQDRVRAERLLRLGRRIAALRPDHLTYTAAAAEGAGAGAGPFGAAGGGAAALGAALAQLAAARAGDHEPPPPPPPVIISEADFREKVREKRVGILKPQGSLERAREERALANTQEDQTSEGEEDIEKGEDKKETRKPRVNIAMAAIMRKQEESNKQVKFITPPPTPDSTADSTEKEQEKPKMIQPKVIKGIVTLPLGRKTGGILSLKDKSAGYPHLVNTDPEPAKKTEKEEKKEPKPSQGSSQNSQAAQQKRQDHPPSPNWSPNPPPNTYDGPRMNFQKNYGIQNAGITYNPNYPSPTNVNNQGIRLPVVNPKEIDVRSAALQKQTARGELFQEGQKFNHAYQISGDKKNFLNDLPPRFANQYRYWQTAQENQFKENKFRDDSFKPNSSTFNSQQPNWPPAQPQETYQQPMSWWKDNPPPNFNANFNQPMNMQPNFYSPHLNIGLSNPYQNIPSFNQMQNPNVGQNKPESMMNQQNFLQTAIGQPQLQTLQNIVSSSNFNSSLNNFGAYVPNVGYDSAMYPQFNNTKLGYQQMPIKMLDKQAPGYPANKDLLDMDGLNFGSNLMDLQQRNMNFNDSLTGDIGALKSMDSIGHGAESAGGEVGGNTYSLFSGAPDTSAWSAGPRQPQQSLWSGPGPSPLERLLEQQKHMKQPPAPQ